MADYINENILCQAYVHVNPDEITDELFDELEKHLKEFVKSRAGFFLYPDADVDIKLKDGSVIVYATILGTVTTLFAAIAGYPKFREGAIAMYEDVKRLSDYIATESIFSSRAKHNQIIRVEARTGIIGSIRKIISKLDNVRASNGMVFAHTLAKYIYQINEDVQTLLGNIKSNEDEVLIKNGFLEIINELPAVPTPPEKRINTDEQIHVYKKALISIKKTLN